ncbi:SpoIIE family protein phosphatase [Streptomyces erythrochromogenes]|uniref:PP2C family protein-serine/threonine phosphatase n=1 Tax=Streptomyces erythrochromogenes TaxID=285574 RepID=UPI00342B0BB6
MSEEDSGHSADRDPSGDAASSAWADESLLEIGTQLAELARSQHRLQSLLAAMLSISRDLDLPAVLRRIVESAVDLVDARYGALGVLDEEGRHLVRFIPVGLPPAKKEELAASAGFPRGEGLLGHLIRHPEPLRVADIAAHPSSAGFPAGHPPMRTLLGASIRVHQRVYGNLYLTDRRDGQAFDEKDESVLVALAGAAGVAIENARLFHQVRTSAEHFQRLLLPSLPDLDPFTTAAVYRPANEPGHLGGDWYDALLLPDGAPAVVIGDVAGHDPAAAAAMSQTRSMLRALLYDRLTPPDAILAQLDRTLHTLACPPVTTTCLARIEPHRDGWQLRWSTAGHLPPLLLAPDGTPSYLEAEPDLPLGVDTTQGRHTHTHPLPAGSTLVLFTDGLVEHHERPLDAGLTALAERAGRHAYQPLARLVRTIARHHPGDGRDDIAIIALRVPGDRRQ